jgi:hypothetical protein
MSRLSCIPIILIAVLLTACGSARRGKPPIG